MTTTDQPSNEPPGDSGVRSKIERTAQLLFDQPGRVIELRALKVPGVWGQGTASAYVDNVASFANLALALDQRGASGVYFTLNPVKPELLARANNRLKENPKTTTADSDVVRRVRLLIDCDPKRASGISSSDAELQLACDLAAQVVSFLTAKGFPDPARALSGNGTHALYAIDLPADDGGLVQRFLHALAFRFNTPEVQIDETVFNPSRICKVYGTMARKGDSLPDRPHRRSEILLPEGGLRTVPVELIEEVAALAPPTEPKCATREPGTINVTELLARANLGVSRSGDWKGGTRWVLDRCPFNAEHADTAAFVVQFGNGALAAGCHHNGCQGKGWSDLRAILEPGWQPRTDGPSFSSFSRGPAPEEEKWPVPEPLPDELSPVAKFNPWLLPDALRRWIVDIADRIQCPLDFPAVAVMIALAAVVGRKLGIRPKRHDNWMVVVNLWGAVIGRPGILKTPAIEEPLKPLRKLELDAKKKFEAEMIKYIADAMVDVARRKEAKKKIQKAVAKEDNAEAKELAQSVVLKRPEKPLRQRFIVNDSTVEKLGELLNENPNGLLNFRDELIGLLKALDKEGQEGARAFYLEAWNGTGRYTYDRIARGTVDIEAAIVSILGGIQPGPLGAYLHHAIEATSQDDGLMQRFQLAVWPDVSRDWVNVDRWPDSDARRAANDLFDRLSKLNPAEVGATNDELDQGGIPFVRFSANAQLMFDVWRASLEAKVRSGIEHPAIESQLAKYRSLVPSLALLIHLAEGGCAPVGEEALAKAIGWAEYLETHARRIYSVVINPDLFSAKALAAKILEHKVKDGFARHEVYRHGWTHLNGPELVERAVSVLIDLGWLRESSSKTTGAPKTTYRINPRIWDVPPAPPEKTERSSASDAGTDDARPGSSALTEGAGS